MAESKIEARAESPLDLAARAREIVGRLHAAYPDARCSLTYRTPLELLVATILSAQCTDDRVNQVTATLFEKYRSAEDFASAAPEELEQDIKSTGFYRNKAKHIREAAQQLVERFGGQVPQTMDSLITLPGVARKTANVVMGNAYGIVEGVVVDTHVGRIAQRLGLSASDDPTKIEHDLMAVVPREDWLAFSHMVIYHGRAICQARKPLCGVCTLATCCPIGQAQLATVSASVSVAPQAAPSARRTSGKARG
jgi:endonuclease-3